MLVDDVVLQPTTYHGGAGSAVVAGSVPWQRGDRLTFTAGNDAGGISFTSVAMANTSKHLFVAWFDKNGDGKLHLVLDNSTTATPVTPSQTPATSALSFIMGGCHNGAGFGQQLEGTLDAVGIADGVPSARLCR